MSHVCRRLKSKGATNSILPIVKLWLLELNPPVCGYDAYEACKSLYAKRSDDPSNERVPSALSEIMGRLSGVQIMVLDTLFGHLQELVRGTKTDEEDSVYLSKLALSLGRGELQRILRESQLTSFHSNPPPRHRIRRNAARPNPIAPLHGPLPPPLGNLPAPRRTRAKGAGQAHART